MWNIGASFKIIQETVGALEVYRYFLRDACVELDDCVVNIVVWKVNGVCAK